MKTMKEDNLSKSNKTEAIQKSTIEAMLTDPLLDVLKESPDSTKFALDRVYEIQKNSINDQNYINNQSNQTQMIDLQKSIQEHKDTIHKLQAQVDYYKLDKQNLEKDLQSKYHRILELESSQKRDSMHEIAKQENLTQDYNSVLAQNERLVEERRKQRTHNEESKEQIENYKKLIQELKESNSNYQIDISDLNIEKTKLESEIQGLKKNTEVLKKLDFINMNNNKHSTYGNDDNSSSVYKTNSCKETGRFQSLADQYFTSGIDGMLNLQMNKIHSDGSQNFGTEIKDGADLFSELDNPNGYKFVKKTSSNEKYWTSHMKGGDLSSTQMVFPNLDIDRHVGNNDQKKLIMRHHEQQRQLKMMQQQQIQQYQQQQKMASQKKQNYGQNPDEVSNNINMAVFQNNENFTDSKMSNSPQQQQKVDYIPDETPKPQNPKTPGLSVSLLFNLSK